MADYQYDLPFDIMDVANILDIRIRRRGARSVYADCPFCGDSRGKLNLNLEKNVFRCNYCGVSGGAIAFYAMIHNIPNSTAYSEICEIVEGRYEKEKRSAIKKIKPKLPEMGKPVSLYERNQTYQMLCAMLSLTKEHRRQLRLRGLSDEQIDRAGYRSTPVFGFDGFAKRLLEKGCAVEGVPGFYVKNNGTWTIHFSSRASGIMIPYRTMSGAVSAFQIRLDNPFVDEKGHVTKYIWFSSVDNEKGVSSGSPAHFVGDPCDETVFVTEGALKADIANALSGRTFLAVAGVGNISSLQEPFAFLKKNGTKNIYECYDSDKFSNPHVKRGASALVDMIKEFGFKPKIMKWDGSYKGIDDMLLSKKKEELK